MLCTFARTFPPQIAERLGRAAKLRRPFREETATELLLMGLVGLSGLGVRVDFSENEASDGADMEWNFVSPLDVGGGSYVRILIQSKVARQAKRKKPYWFYQHLDHKKGAQAAALTAAASASPATLAMYMLFHPQGALCPSGGGHPAVEGVNLILADTVAPHVRGGCGAAKKKLAFWRQHFLPLSMLLCWPQSYRAADGGAAEGVSRLLISGSEADLAIAPLWHPDFIAARLNAEIAHHAKGRGSEISPPLEPKPIPPSLRRAMDHEETVEERRLRRHTRIILISPIGRDDSVYRWLAEGEHRRS